MRQAGGAGLLTPTVGTSALERSKTFANAAATGPTLQPSKPAYTGPAAKPMANTSRLRYIRDPGRPLLPELPTSSHGDAMVIDGDGEANEDPVKRYLDLLSPNLGLCAPHLRAAGVATVEMLLKLEDDEWETLVDLAAPLAEPARACRPWPALLSSLMPSAQ
jgi:hypothetical protein